MSQDEQTRYRPLSGCLTVLLEVIPQVLLSMAVAGAIGAGLSGSGRVALTFAGAVAFVWLTLCMRVSLVLDSAQLQVSNRFERLVISKRDLVDVVPRRMTRGFFGGGGKSFPVVTARVANGDEYQEVRIEATANVFRSRRRQIVERLERWGADTTALTEYLDGYSTH